MINFFRTHKAVSGSISIMLALILLPLYTLISSVIESARYRSAQEQLGELTFLGEMAIIADYVDFLMTDYGLYAFDSKTAQNSFSEYVKSVKSAGGVDTRKLNKLFGLDMEKCDIKYMYSIADPTVLAYQIRENGRYALPVKVMNEVVLSELFGNLGNKLKGINKKLSVVSNCANAVKDSTDMIVNFQTMKSALSNVKAYVNSIYGIDGISKGSAGKCKEIYWTVDWNVINDTDDMSKVYEMWQNGTGIDEYVNDMDNISELLGVMESFSSSMRTYFDLTAEEKSEYKITENYNTKNYLNLAADSENNVKCSDVLAALKQKLSNISLSAGTNINNTEDYERAINSLNELYESKEAFCDFYNNCENLKRYIAAYNIYCENTVNLNNEYGRYLNNLGGMAQSFTNMVESYDSAVALVDTIEMDSAIEDLNEQGKKAREDRVKYEENMNENAKAELKAAMEASAQKRRELYNEARSKRDFSSVGSTLIEKFVSDTFTNNYVGKWKTNFRDKYNAVPRLSDYTTAGFSIFISEMQELKEFDPEIKLVEEYDFCKANGGEAFAAHDFAENIDNFITNEYLKDKFTKKEYISNENLDTIYGIFISPPNGSVLTDVNKKWFNYGDGNSYYLSDRTLVMLFAFLIGTAFVGKNSSASNFLDVLKSVFKTMQNLKPNDISLNNHIGTAVNNISSPMCVFPSQSIYYNSSAFNAAGAYDPSEDERNIKEISGRYANAVVGDTKGFPLDSYYINESHTEDWYDVIFNGRQPGQGIMKLVTGVSGVIDSAVGFIESIKTLNINRGLKQIMSFIDSMIKLVSGIVSFCIDVVQIVAAIINDLQTGDDKCLQYLLNQLYIGFFSSGNFSSRQTAKGCDGDYCDYNAALTNHCGYNCYNNKLIFDGAEMEYILGGSPCEITNQHTAYYAIMMIRFLLNFTLVASDEVVRSVTEIPYAGPVLLVLIVIAESNIDMMFLVGGVKVPLLKSKMSLNPENLDNLVNGFTELVENTKQQKMKWKMGTLENGSKYRIYENNNQTAGEMFDSSLKESLGMGSSSAKGLLSLNYDWYINILLLLYPENVKLGRICDLMQMHGMEKKGTDFSLQDCYTYVYADVRADYSPLLPMTTDSGVFPSLRNVQINGY